MRELFTDPDFTVVGFLKSELEAAGIPCFVRNQHTNTSMTGVPTPLFWPILCLLDHDFLEEAQQIITQFNDARRQITAIEAKDWICLNCTESVPASFEYCWHCEKPRPEPALQRP